MKIFYLLTSIFSLLFAAGAVNAQEAPPLPVLSILEPQNNQEYAADEEVTVKFATTDFLFVDFKNNSELFPGNPNAGHAHFWQDNLEFGHDAAQKILSTDPVELGTLERGTHSVAMELTRNDHSAFTPPVRASVTFTVSNKTLAGETVGGFDVRFGGSGGGVALILLFAAIAAFVIGFIRRDQLRTWLQRMNQPKEV